MEGVIKDVVLAGPGSLRTRQRIPSKLGKQLLLSSVILSLHSFVQPLFLIKICSAKGVFS